MKHRFLRAALCAALLCLLLLACALPALAEEADEAAPAPFPSIVVYNVETDTLLYDNDGARSVAPTVVSKLMTAMIAFDHYASLTDKVTVAAEALRDIGAAGDISAPRLGLSAGSEMTVEDLLCATLVSSANDAACALAYDVSGGDIAAFVEEMNREMLTVKGLKGNYSVLIDGEKIGTWSAGELAEGINLAEIVWTPQYQQALAVMHLNEYRWEIERNFRDYAWMQYDFFQDHGLLDANDRHAVEVLDREKSKNGWVGIHRENYSKLMHPAVREAREKEQELLIEQIYRINKPVVRKIELHRN